MYLWLGWQCKCCCNNWKSILLFPLYLQDFQVCFWCLAVSSFIAALLLYLSTSLIIHWSGSDSALNTLFENQKSLAVITPTLPHSIPLGCLLPTYMPTHPPTNLHSIYLDSFRISLESLYTRARIYIGTGRFNSMLHLDLLSERATNWRTLKILSKFKYQLVKFILNHLAKENLF